MDTTLVTVTLLSMAMAATLSVIVWRMLRLEREGHPGLDLDGVVERPDARDHRWVVLREAQAVAPVVRRRLVLLRRLVKEGLLEPGAEPR